MLERLSLVEVHWKLPTRVTTKGVVPGVVKGHEADGNGLGRGQSAAQETSEVYEMEVELRRARGCRAQGSGAPRVYAPRFPKVGRCLRAIRV